VKLGIRSKLFLVCLGLVAAAVTIAELYLTPTLDRLLTERIRTDLFVRLALCERTVSEHARTRGERDSWDQLAHDLGKRAIARVTVIAGDGTVLGDSELTEPRLRALESHLIRPEVQDALARGRGASTRHSTTLGGRMMYAAVPYRDAAGIAGVVRVAEPLTAVDRAIGRMRRSLVTAAALMLLGASLVSSFAAHWMARTLRRLTEAARAMAGGDLNVRTAVAGNDEIAALSTALDQLAQALSSSLSTLRAERDLFERTLTGMHEGVLALAGDGRVLLVNPSLREMLLLPAEVVGRSVAEAFEHGPLKALLERARSAPSEVSEELEVPGLQPRRLLVHSVHLPGEPPGLLAVLVDVTEIRRLEGLRKVFVANASHELRTPIAAIRSAAETLADAVRHEPAAAPAFIAIIERNSERLQRLVDDLLDLSRIEARELRLSPEPVALTPVVEHVLSLFGARAGQRCLRLVMEIPLELPEVEADRRAFEQVLTNLVDNAVKYCNEGATISVRAELDGASVRLAVEDTGPGIAASHLPRLFERFYRVDPGRSRELGGTGLGLSIVRHLIEAMGGTVSVESVLGQGSRFIVRLPRADR
jgi:two-component system phosphate regulon sensor histidine kinase PhoR